MTHGRGILAQCARSEQRTRTAFPRDMPDGGPRAGEPVLDRGGKGVSDSGLVPDTEYIYAITAAEEASNVSSPTKITVRTLVG